MQDQWTGGSVSQGPLPVNDVQATSPGFTAVPNAMQRGKNICLDDEHKPSGSIKRNKTAFTHLASFLAALILFANVKRWAVNPKEPHRSLPAIWHSSFLYPTSLCVAIRFYIKCLFLSFYICSSLSEAIGALRGQARSDLAVSHTVVMRVTDGE